MICNRNKIYAYTRSYINEIRGDYQHNLFTLAGKEVHDYLTTQRQVDYPLISRFGLGASINHRQITNLFYNKSEKATKNLLLANLI